MNRPPLQIEIEQLRRIVRAIPAKIARVAENFSKERFRAQDWLDQGSTPWPARKRKTGKKSDNRAILVKSGALRRSIRAHARSMNIIISSSMPYAQVHNEGGNVECTQNVSAHSRRSHKRKGYVNSKGRKVSASVVGAHTVSEFSRTQKFKMPKRQFMGRSAALDRQVGKLIDAEIRSALK